MENEATQPGAEVENQQTETASGGDDNAALLSAYLAQEDQSLSSVEQSDPDPAGQPVESQPANDVFTVKINGAEKQVTREELIAHYQKEQAAGQKFEEAAQIRRDAEAQRAQYLQQQQLLQNAINHFQSQAQRYQIAPPSLDLLERDPHEYLRQEAQYKLYQDDLQKAQAAQAYLQQQQSVQQQEFQQKYLAEEGNKLIEKIPEWADNKVRAKDEQELIQFLTDQGYSRQDLIALNQSRASNIKLAYDAMRYNRLVSQAKTATKQVQGLPPRMERSIAPASRDNTGLQAARERLNKTGSIDDAAAAFAEMFGT